MWARYTGQTDQRYELVNIDSHVVDVLRHRPPDSFAARFGDRKTAREPVIATAAGAIAGMFVNFSLSRLLVFR